MRCTVTAMRALYSVPEVAQMCGVNRRTVINWIAAGDLQADKLNGRWMIHARVVHAWLGLDHADVADLAKVAVS